MLISMLLLCFASTVAQVVYTTNFSTEEEFKTWTVFDVNGDEKTWQYDDSAQPSKVFYSYHSSNAANDWLISPAITSTQTGFVAVSIKVKGSSYEEKLQVYYGKSATVEAMTTPVSEVLSLYDTEKTYLYLINVTANEPIYLGMHACSESDRYRLYLCEVKVQFTDNPVDLSVSEITSPVSDFNLGQETVKIKVKNEGSVAVESFDVSFAIDDDTIATEKINQNLAVGAEMLYEFITKADLSLPRKKFALKAWTSHSDDINPNNDSMEQNVLHKASATLPYVMGFESNEYTEDIQFFNLNEDDGNWDLYSDPFWSLSHTGDYCLAYNYNRNNNGNDWAILEPIEITEAGYYVLKFWYSGDDNHPEKLGVYYGTECNPTAMTKKIVEYAPFARSAYEESINIFYIDQPQTIYIGFHAFSDKDENWLCVDDVLLEKVESSDIDLGIYGIVHPQEYVHNGSVKSVEYKVRNYGITDLGAVVKVKIDDDVIAEKIITIKAQEIVTQQLDNVLDNLAEGLHKLVVEVNTSDDKEQVNNVDSVEFRVMGTPTKRWDFEDGKLPADFVFHVEDEGTVNPAAGDEFNEEGWGIFNISQHQLYGKHMLAGTSWLDGTDKADRWCVLPPFCPDKSSYLVWDVASFNPSYLETYSVMISTKGDDPWYYFTEKEYHLESDEHKTRGIDLSSYSEEDTIHVAFRIRSKNCDALILDNIELYGGKIGETDGVESIVSDDVLIRVNANAVTVVGADVSEIVICDMNGRDVVVENSNEISTEGLNSGIYILKITTSDNVITKKVAIK